MVTRLFILQGKVWFQNRRAKLKRQYMNTNIPQSMFPIKSLQRNMSSANMSNTCQLPIKSWLHLSSQKSERLSKQYYSGLLFSQIDASPLRHPIAASFPIYPVPFHVKQRSPTTLVIEGSHSWKDPSRDTSILLLRRRAKEHLHLPEKAMSN
ncbi:retinal homeobox protein Rx2-like [Anneissia japonica]|uniref:retinal homeobox protein Rx2-like n=1 Tax=Anneissia japonica TaxID=1529436 RepID=UPI0014258A98|nr:retinal homeobox protein Rx2-like [Anneissia japonica]